MRLLRIILLFGAIPLLLPAQTSGGWEFRHLSISDGLSDNNIFHIFKDSRGFVWVSTQNGVNRWDGYEFRTYNYNPSDTNSLSGNWVNFTFEDQSGFLWFGTYGAGLCRFDPRTENFVRYPKSSQPGGLSGDVVTCAIQDKSGIFWLGTTHGGLNRFDPATQIFTAFPKPDGLTDEAAMAADPSARFTGPPSAHITCLLEENENSIWVGTAFGLSRFDKRSGKFAYFLHDPQNPRSLPANFVFDLHASRTGAVWVQLSQYWARFESQTLDFQQEKYFPGIPPDAAHGRFWVDENGAVWQGLQTGFRHWRRSHNPFQLDLGRRYPAALFGLKKIRTLVDYEGFIWIASEDGLFRCRIGTDKAERFLPQDFHALLPDGNVLWAASKTEGLFRIQLTNGAVQHFTASDNNRGPTTNNMMTMAKDSWGNIWLGGHGVLNRFDPEEHIFFKDFYPKQPGSSILSLFFDRQKRLWVGTLSEGLWVYFFDDKGQITGMDQFRYDPKNLHSISNDIILSIWEDAQGALWFGTDGGLNGLSAAWQPGTSASFQRYLRSNGLADDKIMSIRDDHKGNLWASHLSHGLSMLSPKTGLVRTFGRADGLPSTLFYWTSAWKRTDGVLLFGTTEGLVAFHPDSLKVENRSAPPVFFTDILLFNKKLELRNGTPALPESPLFVSDLDFTHEQNSLTFCFAAINFVHPELNRYAYRLKPLDEAWHDLGVRHDVSFSHLPPGHYTLQVKACNNEGVWNDTGAIIKFRILPPWWQTAWAYTFYAILLTGLMLLFLQFQVRSAKRKLWQHFSQSLASAETEKWPPNVEIEFLQQLYKLLEQHIADEHFSVEQMAKELTMSRSQLHRKTIEVTGFSAWQLLQNLRLDHARQLLAGSNLSVAEVAFRCGFSDPNYFSRLFSKTQGMTPTEFMQHARV